MGTGALVQRATTMVQVHVMMRPIWRMDLVMAAMVAMVQAAPWVLAGTGKTSTRVRTIMNLMQRHLMVWAAAVMMRQAVVRGAQMEKEREQEVRIMMTVLMH